MREDGTSEKRAMHYSIHPKGLIHWYNDYWGSLIPDQFIKIDDLPIVKKQMKARHAELVSASLCKTNRITQKVEMLKRVQHDGYVNFSVTIRISTGNAYGVPRYPDNHMQPNPPG